MQQLLLFQPGVETLKFFSERLAEEYKALGYEVRLVRIREPFSGLSDLTEYLSRGETTLITFNFHGLQREAIFHTPEGLLLWDLFSVYCINIIVDHPFYYYEELQYLPERYLQICIDEDHTDYMKRFYPQVRLGKTMPLAGCRTRTEFPFQEKDAYGDFSTISHISKGKSQKELLSVSNRSTNVVFTGCFTSPDYFLPYMSRNGEDYNVFYHGILDDLLADPDQCIHTVFLRHLNRELPDLSEEDLKNVMNKMIFIDLWIRFTFRGRVIQTLVDADIPVHCIGAGWETLDCKNKHLLTQSGYSDTAVCLNAIANAKISMNVMPWFKRGSHDRIYSSMANGAVCVTDPSEYLLSHFANGDKLFYYRLNHLDSLPELVSGLLSDPDRLQSVSNRAAVFANTELTWENYAKELQNYIL